ncbi:MAG: hypothetical protein JJU20_12740, partial [Opitutales bacterium]|nr:hypothetical protein [Opitutales bacterium]
RTIEGICVPLADLEKGTRGTTCTPTKLHTPLFLMGCPTPGVIRIPGRQSRQAIIPLMVTSINVPPG